MVHSMTGFSRQKAEGDWGMATWEIRSVNHRFMEPVFRLPEGFRVLEADLRGHLKKVVARGKIECTLRFVPGELTSEGLIVNTKVASELATAINALSATMNVQTPNPLEVLRWPGVVKTAEDNMSQAYKPVLKLFEEALAGLVEIRAAEGQSLAAIITDQLDKLSNEVAPLPEEINEVSKQLQARLVQRLADAKCEVDSDRLEQELVFFAQKSDIAEELDRLRTHIQEVKRALSQSVAIGRRLDFLMQELNREANTLASKSSATAISQRALEAKVIIEQMREQVQNIE